MKAFNLNYEFPLRLSDSKNINLPETQCTSYFFIMLIMNICSDIFLTTGYLTGKSMTKFILEIRNQDGFSDISGLYIAMLRLPIGSI